MYQAQSPPATLNPNPKVKVKNNPTVISRSSVLNYDGAKLFRAIIDCIHKSEKLHSISIDGIRIPPELFESLGRAISTCKSDIRYLAIRGTQIGDEGFRLITPFIAKSRCRVIYFDKCGLSDISCTYIASIIKAQEAIMDNIFWNNTLRDDSSSLADPICRVQARNCGIQAMSFRANKFTSKGMVTLGKYLRRNQWIVALNFAANRIDNLGMAHLAKSLELNTTLHTLVLAGNPGYKTKTGVALDMASKQARDLELEELQRHGHTGKAARPGSPSSSRTGSNKSNPNSNASFSTSFNRSEYGDQRNVKRDTFSESKRPLASHLPGPASVLYRCLIF